MGSLFIGFIWTLAIIALFSVGYYLFRRDRGAQESGPSSGYVQSQAFNQQLRSAFNDLLGVATTVGIPEWRILKAVNESSFFRDWESIEAVVLADPESLVFKQLLHDKTFQITLVSPARQLCFSIEEVEPAGMIVVYYVDKSGQVRMGDYGFNFKAGTKIDVVPMDKTRAFLYRLSKIVEHHRAIQTSPSQLQ